MLGRSNIRTPRKISLSAITTNHFTAAYLLHLMMMIAWVTVNK